MISGEDFSIVWRQPFGTLPDTDLLSCHLRTSTMYSSNYLVTCTPTTLRVYGLLSKRHILLREVDISAVKSALKVSKWKASFSKAWMYEERVIVSIKAGDVKGQLVLLSFGLFDSQCRVVGMVEGDVVDVCCSGECILTVSTNNKLSIYHGGDQVCQHDLPIVGPCKLTAIQVDQLLVAIGSQNGQWCLLRWSQCMEEVGVYGSDACHSPVTDLQIITHSDHIDLMSAVGGFVYLQRFTNQLDLVESREILSLPAGHTFRQLGVFKRGAKPGMLPVVIASDDKDQLVSFHITIIHTNRDGLMCEDFGVDRLHSLPIHGMIVDEDTLECTVLTRDHSVMVYSGLTLRNSWSPTSISMSSLFDFAKWFNLFGPFPYDPLVFPGAVFDEYSTQLAMYPPGSWSDLRALVDDIVENKLGKYERPQVLLYYVLLDHDQKAASRFAWEFGVTAEECRRVQMARRGVGVGKKGALTIEDRIKRFGVAVVINESLFDLSDIIDCVLLEDEMIKKEFLDYPFDSASLDLVINHLKSIPDNQQATDLLLSLLFYHSRFTELLTVSQEVSVQSETMKQLLENVAMMVGMGTTEAVFVEKPKRTRSVSTVTVDNVRRTPVKHKTLTVGKKSTPRQFSPVPLVNTPVLTDQPPLSTQGLKRQPSMVTLLAPRHHATLTPSRLKEAVLSDSSTSGTSEVGDVEPESIETLKRPKSVRSRSKSPAKTPKRIRTRSASPMRIVDVDLNLPPHSPHHPPLIITTDEPPLTVTLRNRAKSLKTRKRQPSSDSIRHSPRLARKTKQ